MSHPKPEWLVALADGELRGWRRRRVERHAQVCPVCAAEYRQQRHVGEWLRKNPQPVAMRESAEFFWSKVRGEIQRQAPPPAELPVPRPALVDWAVQHRLQMAAVVAALLVAVGLVWVAGSAAPGAKMVAAAQPGLKKLPTMEIQAVARVEQARAPVENAVATVLPTEQADIAVVWISGLPWTKDMDEMMSVFANLDS